MHQLTGKIPGVLDYQFRPATYTSVIEAWLVRCLLASMEEPSSGIVFRTVGVVLCGLSVCGCWF